MRFRTSLTLSIFLLAPVALAQSDAELAARQDLINQAQDARTKGDHGSALSLMKKASAIRVTPSLRLFVAEEAQAVGAIGDAYAAAKQCAIEAERDVNLRNRADIITSCKGIENALASRVPRITIKPETPPEGLRIVVGGADLNAALWNQPYIVNPGKVTIEASAPKHVASKVEIDVAEGQALEQVVKLEPSPVAEVAPPPDKKPEQPAAAAATSSRSIVPLIVAGAGVVVAGAGLVSWLVSDGKYGDLETKCASNAGCSTRVFNEEADSIKTLDAIAVTGFVVGGAAIAGGLIWYFASAPSSDAPKVGITGDPLTRSLRVVGSF